LTVLWSLIIGFMYWNLRSSLTTVLSHIPEATPTNSRIWNDIPNVVGDYLDDLKSQLKKTEKQVSRKQKDAQRKYQQELNQLERDNRFLQKERDELRVKYEGPDKVEEMARLHMRELAFQEQVELLQEATRRESRRTVLERFGPGPHFVKMMFEIPQRDNYQGEFLIELAPLDAVPHAIHLFLEQVDHGLWNRSTYFYLNGPHVLQAGPSLDEEDDEEQEEHHNQDDESSRKPFERMGLDELAFPDYSETFPHVTWTVGFTGRPGGPDFYINKVDNTEGHGPGGQYQHALEEQGDACFGKIVQGRDSVAKIFTQPVYNDGSDWHYFLSEPVRITGAVVLPTETTNEDDNNNNNNNNEGNGDGNTNERRVDNIERQDADDMVNKINEKIKRRPRLPKIDHAVEP